MPSIRDEQGRIVISSSNGKEIWSKPDDPRHGTWNGYANLGCRCPACTAAWRDYFRETSHRLGYNKPRDVYLAELAATHPIRHGTTEAHAQRCRRRPEGICQPCRAVTAQVRRERRARAGA